MSYAHCVHSSHIRLFLTVIVSSALAASATVHARQPSAQPVSRTMTLSQDSNAMTRSGLYASEREAGLMASVWHDRVITVRVDCCGKSAIDRAVKQVWNTHVAYDTPSDIAVLVLGKNSLQAAQVVDRLSELGLSRVWLVTAP
ncbi:MAG: hypothetical protein JSS56_23085 [Proteobacteria bacterium]|nr:hypothetical protein [Pseudomonadota bacterium]